MDHIIKTYFLVLDPKSFCCIISCVVWEVELIRKKYLKVYNWVPRGFWPPDVGGFQCSAAVYSSGVGGNCFFSAVQGPSHCAPWCWKLLHQKSFALHICLPIAQSVASHASQRLLKTTYWLAHALESCILTCRKSRSPVLGRQRAVCFQRQSLWMEGKAAETGGGAGWPQKRTHRQQITLYHI